MISASEAPEVAIITIRVTEHQLELDLSDGRSVTVPISWYPRLSHARREDLENWELTGRGYGVHWSALDEDISVKNILVGEGSAESAQAFEKWKAWYASKQSNG